MRDALLSIGDFETLTCHSAFTWLIKIQRGNIAARELLTVLRQDDYGITLRIRIAGSNKIYWRQKNEDIDCVCTP